MRTVVAVFIILWTTLGFSQEKERFSKAIEDNSFLIEEAYNQEEGVVQHIWSGMYQPGSPGGVVLGFTEEWPLFSAYHQVSASIPYTLSGNSGPNGFGDILINYRYQLLEGDDGVDVAPRFSVVLPTGNVRTGLGFGRVGFQVNLPASKRLSEAFVLHVNAGLNLTPNARGFSDAGIEYLHTMTSYAVGASVITLLSENVNAMLECLLISADTFNDDGGVDRINQLILNPGIRGAINLGNLQIVPGVAVPITYSGDQVTTGWFLYLSFEHSL
jgi:hypothetical protein